MIKTTGEENSLDGTPPGDCLDGQMESMTISTGKGWREIGDSGKM